MKFTYVTGETDTGRTVRDIIRREFGFSNRLVRRIRNEGLVFLNGEEKRLNTLVVTGDQIGVDVLMEESYFEAEDIPVTVVYEDDDVMVVNKQPGLVVHPTKGQPSGTLANALMNYMQKNGQKFKIRFVNRLDRDTSGLLVVAKSAHAQETLIRQMSKKEELRRGYVAIVKGMIDEDQGTINLPIGSRGENMIGRCVKEDGASAITHFRVLRRFPAENYTLLKIHLETGRTHQIRVHFSHIGHPVAGDPLYGDPSGDPHIKRQALHASEVAFRHPMKATVVQAVAQAPEDFREMALALLASSDPAHILDDLSNPEFTFLAASAASEKAVQKSAVPAEEAAASVAVAKQDNDNDNK